ncbi:MAG: ACT domain-containing protein [Gemmatimonas sp.]|nr:ACT domain-containing protein [Gemmatimonas sp.]
MADGQFEESPRVAFQGELGAFSEEAVHRYFGEGVEAIPQRDFAEVGRSVVDGEVDYGLLPIENTLAGSVVGSYDVLGSGDLTILGEVITPIHHCVLGLPGAAVDRLERILSHPVALMQCTRFLRSLPHVDAVVAYDTAGAAKDIADQSRPTQAAIAGRRAAARYGLEVLAENVEDRPDNQTRFLVVAASADALPPRTRGTPPAGPMKSALLIETANEPGTLLRILSPFAERSINLSKLESRPAGEPWTYRFFMEFDEDAAAPSATAALSEVATRAVKLQLLGTYPRWIDG